MSDVKETAGAWRKELVVELTEARAALSSAEAEFAVADVAAQDARAVHRELQDFLQPIEAHGSRNWRAPIAGPLAPRLDEFRRAVTAADGLRARADGARSGVNARISALMQAIEQIDVAFEIAQGREAA